MKKENLIQLQNSMNVLLEKHSKMIDNNNFEEALCIMRNIEMVSKQMRDFSAYQINEYNTIQELLTAEGISPTITININSVNSSDEADIDKICKAISKKLVNRALMNCV